MEAEPSTRVKANRGSSPMMAAPRTKAETRPTRSAGSSLSASTGMPAASRIRCTISTVAPPRAASSETETGGVWRCHSSWPASPGRAPGRFKASISSTVAPRSVR